MTAGDRPRVCYVSETARMGGGEFSLLGMLEAASGKCETSVITYGSGPLIERLDSAGAAYRILERKGGLSDLLLIAKLAGIFRRERVDLVHVNTLDIRAGAAARLAGVGLIGHLRVIIPFTWVDRLFVRLAHRVIAVSAAARDALSAGDPSLAGKFSVIHNGVTAVEQTIDVRPELGLSSDTLIVGAVGRIDPVKGFEYLIGAMPRILEQCPSAHLVIAGEPGTARNEQEYFETLKQMAEDLVPGRVHTLGFRRDAAELVGGFDVLAVPSIVRQTPEGVWAEGFGRVAAEGMAAGVPVVAARTGGLPEIVVDGESGRLVAPADSDALAQAITEILSDPGRRADMSTAAVARHRACFTLENQMREILDTYDAVRHDI